MVSSLDGYIASSDNSLSWLDSHDNSDEGLELSKEKIEAFVSSIDCFVMGFHTYERTLKIGWPYGDTSVIVINNKSQSSERTTVQI